MTQSDLQKLCAIIDQTWAEDYPPELAPVDIKGRKMWRKVLLIELIKAEFGGLAA